MGEQSAAGADLGDLVDGIDPGGEAEADLLVLGRLENLESAT